MKRRLASYSGGKIDLAFPIQDPRVTIGKRVERLQLKDGDRVKLGPYEFYFETNVPSEDWVPSHIIDMSSEVHKHTIRKPEPPEGK